MACVKSLYEQYKIIEIGAQISFVQTSIQDEDDAKTYCMSMCLQAPESKSKLEKFLNDGCEPLKAKVELYMLNLWIHEGGFL